MKIETERLEIIPLTSSELKLWIEDISALEKELSCIYRGEPLEDWFLEIIKGQLEITENDPENYLWHSFWLLVRKCDRTVIGSADFKDVPDNTGEVEIGYGLGKEFEHNGFMTEAVKAMCKWALDQKNVTCIIAETGLDGYASQRILQRCGFFEDRRDKTIWWRL